MKSEPPQQTILHSSDSTEKAVFVDDAVKQVLSELSGQTNKKYTQGVIAYEYLLMERSDLTDTVDEIEAEVDKELAELGVLPDLVNNVRYDKEERIEPADDTSRIRLWLPASIAQQADWQRGWGRRINDAVRNGINSPFNDRLDRIEVKQGLLDRLATGSTTNDTAQMIVDDTPDLAIPEKLRTQTGAISIETPTDYARVSDHLDTWQRRFDALDDMMQSSDTPFDNLVGLLSDTHEIESEDYVRRKVREFAREYDYDQLTMGSSESFNPEDIDRDVYVGNIPAVYSSTEYTIEEVVVKALNETGEAKTDMKGQVLGYTTDASIVADMLINTDVVDNDGEFSEIVSKSDHLTISNNTLTTEYVI